MFLHILPPFGSASFARVKSVPTVIAGIRCKLSGLLVANSRLPGYFREREDHATNRSWWSLQAAPIRIQVVIVAIGIEHGESGADRLRRRHAQIIRIGRDARAGIGSGDMGGRPAIATNTVASSISQSALGQCVVLEPAIDANLTYAKAARPHSRQRRARRCRGRSCCGVRYCDPHRPRPVVMDQPDGDSAIKVKGKRPCLSISALMLAIPSTA